jgi:UDP-N-acetylmuramoyl-tripeptide--D-alanyl-D-alanine ligase
MASFLGGLFARLKPSLLPERKARTKKRWEGNAVGACRAGLDHVTFVAITGSCGKSTARALTAAILESGGPCQHGETWNVDRLGHVLKRVGPATRSCVCEIGATGPGSLSEPLRLLRPQIGIVTTIGGDHFRAFRSLEATALEKGKLVECLPPNGTAILNADDLLVLGMAERTGARVTTFGTSDHAHVRASEISSQWPDPLAFTATHEGKSVRIETRFFGEHWVTSMLAAITCGIACGFDLATCATIVKSVEPYFGHYSVHRRPDGGAYVLDTRKAPYWTILSALQFVADARASRKTVLFGTISDYSGDGGSRYRRIARQALQVADRVIFVGPNSISAAKLRTAELSARLFTFPTAYQAHEYLHATWTANELIYVKCSTVDHLERVMLAELDTVVCWKERCGSRLDCHVCRKYRIPAPPPAAASAMSS